jgi:hypothetical protein
MMVMCGVLFRNGINDKILLRRANPAEDDGFLRAIEVRSTTSFGGK